MLGKVDGGFFIDGGGGEAVGQAVVEVDFAALVIRGEMAGVGDGDGAA